jgi:hypothetical protein
MGWPKKFLDRFARSAQVYRQLVGELSNSAPSGTSASNEPPLAQRYAIEMISRF